MKYRKKWPDKSFNQCMRYDVEPKRFNKGK
jgi:hypothetical protein